MELRTFIVVALNLKSPGGRGGKRSRAGDLPARRREVNAAQLISA
jgi:hypothetical protein